ncbi:hypothetical protein ACFS6H_02625 [Terrimonas rubra]|uniref:Dual OB-containing domain-containing protein n=1 Tax=Terrimonas rubra TaxID=1035890 RepID=A0ABW6A3G7_9BACT
MNVLIVSKTRMHHGQCCVGGLTLEGKSIRLIMNNGNYPPENTDLSPGFIYNMKFTSKSKIDPPHIEDVIVQSYDLVEPLQVRMLDFIRNMGVPVWEGSPEELFDGKLQWTDNGSGYINKADIPTQSVGFWIPNQTLRKNIYYKKTRYSCNSNDTWYNIPYIGYDDAVKIIPAGTLIRVSLARWWDQMGTTELRCPLQLSGWYDR